VNTTYGTTVVYSFRVSLQQEQKISMAARAYSMLADVIMRAFPGVNNVAETPSTRDNRCNDGAQWRARGNSHPLRLAAEVSALLLPSPAHSNTRISRVFVIK
jgi:hypothetical protein